MHEQMPPPENFLAWLLSLAPDDSVGEPQKACLCPLARWLNATVGMTVPDGGSNFTVGRTCITGWLADGSGVSWRHTVWSEAFMLAVDRSYLVQIPATVAIQLLTQVQEALLKVQLKEGASS
jgi:hypothetical protein